MRIRDKVDADTDACVDLLRRVHAADGYPLYLTPEQLPEYLASGKELDAWVGELDGRVVGHVALHDPTGTATLELAAAVTGLPAERLVLLARLFVAPEARRTGLGRALLRHAAARATALGLRAVLDVGQPFVRAVALYEQEGWQRAGELHLPLDERTILDLWVYVSP